MSAQLLRPKIPAWPSGTSDPAWSSGTFRRGRRVPSGVVIGYNGGRRLPRGRPQHGVHGHRATTFYPQILTLPPS